MKFSEPCSLREGWSAEHPPLHTQTPYCFLRENKKSNSTSFKFKMFKLILIRLCVTLVYFIS